MPPRYRRVFEPLRPLTPALADDLHRYQDIDGFEEMFNKFKNYFADPADWVGQGNIVVVTGDRGSGKTSLIQRCACWLRDEDQRQCEVVVVDLVEERWLADDAMARVIRASGRVTDALAAGSFASGAQVRQVRDQGNDVVNIFRYLGLALQGGSGAGAVPAVPVLVLPAYSSLAEVGLYHDLICRGMFVFAEILAADRSGAERDYLRELSRPGVDLQPLETGTLREQDAERMMDRIRRDFPQAPELPEHLFQKYLVTLVNADHHPMTAKALAMEACAYLAEAEAEGAQRVTEDHLIRYYQRLARELSRREGS